MLSLSAVVVAICCPFVLSFYSSLHFFLLFHLLFHPLSKRESCIADPSPQTPFTAGNSAQIVLSFDVAVVFLGDLKRFSVLCLQSIQDKSGKMLKEVDLLRQKVRDFDGRIGAGAANNLK